MLTGDKKELARTEEIYKNSINNSKMKRIKL